MRRDFQVVLDALDQFRSVEIIRVTREALLYILPYIFNAGQGKSAKMRNYCWN